MHLQKAKFQKHTSLILFIAIIALFAFVYLSNSHESDNVTVPEYMIDVVLENKSGYTLSYLQMGVVLSETELKVLDDVLSYEDNLFHFFVGYNQGTDFFLRYKLKGNDSEETFFFNLNEMNAVEEPQIKKFEINTNGKIEICK